MATANWKQLIESKPHELVLSGKNGAKQIEDEEGLNEMLFKISSLNFLEVSTSGLLQLPSKIEELSSLTNLVLHGNKLTRLPPAIGKLKKLKLLDVSRNELKVLPDELSQLSELQSLLVSGNQLESLPSDLTSLSFLLVVKIDQNNLTEFPVSLLNEENPKVNLTEVHAQKNKIVSIPWTINRLVGLKVLDLRDNCVRDVPGELGDCSKLKELSLEGNKLTDRRFLKLVEQKKSKQVMDYIRSHFPRSGEKEKGRDGSYDRRTLVKDGRRRRRSRSRSSVEKSQCLMDTIRVMSVKEDAWFTVTCSLPALEQRKIVACIVRKVDLSREGMLRRFLQLQTNLHDSVCGKRTLATIAVHDLDKIPGKISFDVKPPGKMRLHPLNRMKEMSASELYKVLMEEAENVRKEKKRNTFSGIHKYLYLLKGKSRYSCLIDSHGNIISFPPITNSHNTRMTEETRSLFLEVTGESQPTCKKVMDSLLHGMVKLGIGASSVEPQETSTEKGETSTEKGGTSTEKGETSTEKGETSTEKGETSTEKGETSTENGNLSLSIADEAVKPHLLQVEPVKVIDAEGKLYVVYPSRPDLIFEDINVVR